MPSADQREALASAEDFAVQQVWKLILCPDTRQNQDFEACATLKEDSHEHNCIKAYTARRHHVPADWPLDLARL
jgi:hypothetical protein